MRLYTTLVAATSLIYTALAVPSVHRSTTDLDLVRRVDTEGLFALSPEDAQRQPGPPGNGPKPGEALYTNAVTYCAEAKAVLIDTFDIAYWRANNSVTFSFSFASVEPNLNVSASLYLNAYGIELFNETIYLCDLVAGVLCPLPQVNFTGFGTYPLPTEIQSQIPSIGWTVPNLEAYARVQLHDISDGEVAACLQATLSNGWTTQFRGVKWASGLFTLAAGLVGLAHALFVNSISPAIYRWFDILTLYQTAAAAGLMHLNYPLTFSNFVQNFHWSLGLFYSKPMQSSISVMRNNTGGHMPGDAYDQVKYINRKLSPYNSPQFFSGVNLTGILDDADALPSFISTLKADAIAKRASAQKIPSLIDQQGASNLTTGIPVYTNSMGITQANAYDTIFFFFLALLAIVIAFNILVGVVAWVFARGRKNNWATRLSDTFWDFCYANVLRACLVFFFPIFIFGFYQWNIGTRDSGLSIFFAVLGVLMVLAPLVTAFVFSVFRARRLRSHSDVSPLYTDYHFYHAVGDALYRQYRQKYHFFWFAPILLGMIAKAGFIGFGQGNAWAQVIGCIAVEFIVLCCQLVLRPHKDRKGDWLGAILTIFRMAIFGLLIAFIESMHVKPIPRTAIGIVEIALVGIPTVILFFGLIFNAFYGVLWCKKRARIEDGIHLERDEVFREKGTLSTEDDRTLQSLAHGYETRSSMDEPSDTMPAMKAYESAASGQGSLNAHMPQAYDPPGRVSDDVYTHPYRQSYPLSGNNRLSGPQHAQHAW